MTGSNRRQFLLSAAGLTGGLLLGRRLQAANECLVKSVEQPLSYATHLGNLKGATVDRVRFEAWLRGPALCAAAGARNMVWNFYDPVKKVGRWVYPMLSGKAILWHLQAGQVDDAKRLASALFKWQQIRNDGLWARSYGAFPSVVEQDGEHFKTGDCYYAGDNLVLLDALVALHRRTGEIRYLNSAIGIGTWLTSVMCQGHRYGVWTEDHGAPMYYVRQSGDFSNHIHLNVEMMWIGALTRLGELTGESVYCAQAEKARAFYVQGQLPNGAFYDHYDPSYPPKSFDRERFVAYQPNQVISDNQLRCALGACRMGRIDMAQRFFRWLKPEDGAVPAYLNLATGSSGFPDKQDAYYDVSSSGLYRSLCQWLNKGKEAEVASVFLRQSQHANGGWYWGLKRGSLAPVAEEQAPIVGLWATADLSPFVV